MWLVDFGTHFAKIGAETIKKKKQIIY